MRLAVAQDLLDFRHVVQVAGQVGRKEFGRIMAFQPAGLVRHPGIAGRMGLVEGVLGELFPVLPDLVQGLFRVAVGKTSGHELVLQFIQDGDLFLAHRLAELVSLALREPCQLLGQKHNLLLIDRDSVRILQIFLHVRKVVFDRLEPQFPVHEVRDIIHRARTVQGVHCDEVLEPLRMQPLKPLLHSRRFKLEHTVGVSTAVQPVGLLVVDRYGFYVDVDPVAEFDIVQAGVDDGKGVQAQEVHLQHSDILDVVPVVLRGPDIFLGVLVLREADRDMLGQVAAADDGRAGVHSDLADAAFHGLGVLKDFLYLVRTVLQLVLQFRNQAVAVLEGDLDIGLLHSALEPLLDASFHFLLGGLEAALQLIQFWIVWIFLPYLFPEPVRDKGGEPVGFVQREVMDSGDILDGALRQHCSESDDSGNVILAVSIFDILVGEAEVFEIHVDIRHRYTVRIEETLEQELVADRVQVGDSETVSYYRSGGGATARPDQASFLPAGGYIVLDDEEVVRETHPADCL